MTCKPCFGHYNFDGESYVVSMLFVGPCVSPYIDKCRHMRVSCVPSLAPSCRLNLFGALHRAPVGFRSLVHTCSSRHMCSGGNSSMLQLSMYVGWHSLRASSIMKTAILNYDASRRQQHQQSVFSDPVDIHCPEITPATTMITSRNANGYTDSRVLATDNKSHMADFSVIVAHSTSIEHKERLTSSTREH